MRLQTNRIVAPTTSEKNDFIIFDDCALTNVATYVVIVGEGPSLIKFVRSLLLLCAG